MIMNSRYLNDEKESILSMIEQEALPSGSGFDGEWALKLTFSTRVNAFASFHVINDGYYDGWVYFTVHFDIADKKVFKVTISSDNRNRALERKHALREYLTDTICYHLQDAQIIE